VVPGSVIELQPFRRAQVQRVADAAGREGTATLIDLNPAIGRWHLLALDWGDGQERYFHLESSAAGQTVALDPGVPGGLLLGQDGENHVCELWSTAALTEATAQPTSYAPLCGGRLHLHNAVRGHASHIETVVEFLRRRVPGGEELITATKQTVFRDAGRERVNSAARQARLRRPPGCQRRR
jgi:hypothetical protein